MIAIDEKKPAFSLPLLILAGLVVGVLLGFAARWIAPPDDPAAPAHAWVDWTIANVAQPIGNIFLNFMFMVVLPLIFTSLALGVAGLGDLKAVGRLGLKLLLGTLLLTGAGVAIGLALVNAVRPGEGLPEEARARLIARTQDAEVEKKLDQARAARSFGQMLSDSISRNPIEDAANLFNPNPNYRGGGILAFMVFTIIVGLTLTAIGPEKARPVVELLESVQALSMTVIGWAMRLAPFGVAALIFQTTAQVGVSLFGVLGKFVGVVIAGLLIQMFVTYSLALLLVARRSPVSFFAQTYEVILTAFSTSSSSATLPTSLRTAREKLKLPPDFAAFTLTIGATANQNGSALFEGVTVLFLAQFYGIHLDLPAQASVVLMSILAGVGTAGVPGGSIPPIALLLQSIGVPAAGVGIILGVDRLLDMSRTTVNVVGDLVLATMVSPREEPTASKESALGNT